MLQFDERSERLANARKKLNEYKKKNERRKSWLDHRDDTTMSREGRYGSGESLASCPFPADSSGAKKNIAMTTVSGDNGLVGSAAGRQSVVSLPSGGTFFHDERRSAFYPVQQNRSASSQVSPNAVSTLPFVVNSVGEFNESVRICEIEPAVVLNNLSSTKNCDTDTTDVGIAQYAPLSELDKFLLDKNVQNSILLANNDEKNVANVTNSQMIPSSITTSSSSGASTATEYIQPMEYIRNVEQKNKELMDQNAKLKETCNHATTQWQQWHAHYEQLNAAYDSLSQSAQQKYTDDTNFGQAELRQQVQQHLQTIGILVDEKSELKSQLRQAMEIANVKHVENEELSSRLKTNQEQLSDVKRHWKSADRDRTGLEDTLARQKEELDKRRLEASQWEAKVVQVQQDRSELQARLKVKSREMDRVQAESGDLRKQLHMKEIYIRQLNAHAAGVAQQQQQEDIVNALQLDNEQLQADMEQSRSVAEQWKNEAEQCRQQYEMYGRQLNQKVVDLSAQVERIAEEKLLVESENERLEQQLALKTEENVPKKTDQDQEVMISDQSGQGEDAVIERASQHLQLMEAKNYISQLLDRLARVENENGLMNQTLMDRTNEVDNRKQEADQMRLQLDCLREKLETRNQCSTDSRSLIDQLQNEKATVSRAVAQNRDLKLQLTELQDKFVQMTEENMERETRMQTLNHTFEEMTKNERAQYEQLEQAKNANKLLVKQLEVLKNSGVDVNSVNGQLATEEEDVQEHNKEITTETKDAIQREQATDSEKQQMDDLREQLDYVSEQLRLCRANERRVNGENEQLRQIMQQNAEDENQNNIHVELQRAFDRVTALSSENDNLKRLIQQNTAAAAPENGHPAQTDDHSSVCSEHQDKKRDRDSRESVETLRGAMEQLQERLARAMTQNADLTDQNQQMEHLILQLQTETDTIGEYVTIYQHQRRVIRERLREKEALVAKIAREKEQTQTKLNELQALVMTFMQEKGALHEYGHTAASRGRKTKKSPHGQPTKLAVKPRSFSQTTVDELSGDEELVVDGTHDQIPVRSQHPIELTGHEGQDGSATMVENGDLESGSEAEMEASVHTMNSSLDHQIQHQLSQQKYTSQHRPSSASMDENSLINNSETSDRIVRLLAELQAPHLDSDRPPLVDQRLHCKECRGKLIVLCRDGD